MTRLTKELRTPKVSSVHFDLKPHHAHRDPASLPAQCGSDRPADSQHRLARPEITGRLLSGTSGCRGRVGTHRSSPRYADLYAIHSIRFAYTLLSSTYKIVTVIIGCLRICVYIDVPAGRKLDCSEVNRFDRTCVPAAPRREDYMRTTTVRLDDDLMELIEEVAALRGKTASEVIRAGIREYIRILANQDEDIRNIRDAIAQRLIVDQTNATRRRLGMDPIDSPSDQIR
jgi:predicted transcriptional regulator